MNIYLVIGEIISYKGEEALRKVKQDGYALQFVDESIFKNEIKEYTIEQLQEKLGEESKIIK